MLRVQDSNLRPSGNEPDELPDCSNPHGKHTNKNDTTKFLGGKITTGWVNSRVELEPLNEVVVVHFLFYVI
jgi:hypothetical protein